MFCVLRCDLRFFDRFEISMCMGGKPGVNRSLFWKVVLACAMLEAMSGCSEFSVSYSGVGPGGVFVRRCVIESAIWERWVLIGGRAW